jgi:hypothetical protein
MIHAIENIAVIAVALLKFKPENVVIYPVMISKNGSILIDEGMIFEMQKKAVSTCSASVEEAVSSVLPCLWVYREVGKNMAALPRVENNPYECWIALYSSVGFDASVNLAVDITNALGAHASPALSEKMLGAFLRATQLEWIFWDSAYRLEAWAIS